jgi:hypothetical protein
MLRNIKKPAVSINDSSLTVGDMKKKKYLNRLSEKAPGCKLEVINDIFYNQNLKLSKGKANWRGCEM